MNLGLIVLSNLIISVMLALTAPTYAGNATSKVSQITSLAEISSDHPNETLFLFDIDDTVFDSFSMLGSKAWRKYIVEAAKKIDPSENWHDIITYALAQKHPLNAVEKITSSYIKDLQNNGYVVCGLTARERKIWYDMHQDGIDILTVNQLSTVNVDFNNGSLENTYPYLSTAPEYYSGIFFANLEPKGNYLLRLFENAPALPQKIIFVDDKLSQVESVDAALTLLGIPHECYFYSATDEKGKAFNPLIANIQLYYFYVSGGQRIISDKEAAILAQIHSNNDAELYLRAALDLAKMQITPQYKKY